MSDSQHADEEVLEHRIEQIAKVYLLWNATTRSWDIDPITFDGHPLDGYTEGGADDAMCECGGRTPEHIEDATAAILADLPTGQELARAMTAHYEADLAWVSGQAGL